MGSSPFSGIGLPIGTNITKEGLDVLATWSQIVDVFMRNYNTWASLNIQAQMANQDAAARIAAAQIGAGATVAAAQASAQATMAAAAAQAQATMYSAQLNYAAELARIQTEAAIADVKFFMEWQSLGMQAAIANWQQRMAIASFELDVARYGLDVARTNAEMRARRNEQRLQALKMLAEKAGPQDWVAYNYLLNAMVPPDALARGEIDPLKAVEDTYQEIQAEKISPPAYEPIPMPEKPPPVQVATPKAPQAPSISMPSIDIGGGFGGGFGGGVSMPNIQVPTFEEWMQGAIGMGGLPGIGGASTTPFGEGPFVNVTPTKNPDPLAVANLSPGAYNVVTSPRDVPYTSWADPSKVYVTDPITGQWRTVVPGETVPKGSQVIIDATGGYGGYF